MAMWRNDSSLLLFKSTRALTTKLTNQAPVVRKLDCAIHQINRYPEDKYYDNQLRYSVDSDLSSG